MRRLICVFEQLEEKRELDPPIVARSLLSFFIELNRMIFVFFSGTDVHAEILGFSSCSLQRFGKSHDSFRKEMG